jgi:hypothetical protein
VRHRWLLFLGALVGSGLIATGFAIGMDRAMALNGPAPRLTTVPPATLSSAGYSLAPPALPPYCGEVRSAADRGWLPVDLAGCPISRETAVAIALPSGGRVVDETLLARVSSLGTSSIGQNRLTWLVVMRFSSLMMPMYVCPNPAVGLPCPAVAPSFAGREVVFVDAHTAMPLEVLPVGTPSPAGMRVSKPASGTG